MIPPPGAVNLVEVAIPSGGRAWARRRLTVEQALVRSAAKVSLARHLPPDLAAGGSLSTTEIMAAMTARGDPADLLRAIGAGKIETVRSCVWGWEGVRSPDGDELVFPADVPRMDAADLEALYEAQEAAIETADPNAGRDRSSRRSRGPVPIPAGPSTSTSPG